MTPQPVNGYKLIKPIDRGQQTKLLLFMYTFAKYVHTVPNYLFRLTAWLYLNFLNIGLQMTLTLLRFFSIAPVVQILHTCVSIMFAMYTVPKI